MKVPRSAKQDVRIKHSKEPESGVNAAAASELHMPTSILHAGQKRLMQPENENSLCISLKQWSLTCGSGLPGTEAVARTTTKVDRVTL